MPALCRNGKHPPGVMSPIQQLTTFPRKEQGISAMPPAGTTRAGFMERSVQVTHPSAQRLGFSVDPIVSVVSPHIRRSTEAVLENIEVALVYQALGRLSINPEVFAANRPQAAEMFASELSAAEAFQRFIGKTSVKQALEHTGLPQAAANSELTLAQSVLDAKKGDKNAEARVDINVATATCEAFFKERHITRVWKDFTDTGDVVQLGLSAEQMQEDSLVHRAHRPAELKQFTLAEARNSLREQQLARDGVLDSAWFIAASFVPRGMEEDKLDYRGDGYFTRAMTYSLQGSTRDGARIMTETVFDRGTTAEEKASFDDRQAGRFDLQAYRKICEWLGVPVPASELEALENPLVISKELMPNGMKDFWRWMDIAADEVKGELVVRTVDEYLERERISIEREASIADVRRRTKEELMAIDDFDHHIEVNDLLWELTRKFGYKDSARNEHIQPLVFGIKAAHKLRVAKDLISLGHDDEAERWIEAGLPDASVSGCGGGVCGIRDFEAHDPRLSQAKTLLNFEEGDSISIDEERPCIKCGEVGTVAYVYNHLGKLNKGCLNPNCGATEFKLKGA